MLSALLQTVGAVFLLGSYFPQIIKILKTKNVEGLSKTFFVILFLGLSCITGNMIITHTNLWIILTQAGNALLALIIIILICCYESKEV